MRIRISIHVGLVACCGLAASAAAGMRKGPPREANADFDPDRLDKEVLIAAAQDVTQLEVLADGRLLFTEIEGTVKLRDPVTGAITVAGKIPVSRRNEVGLLGLVADRRFAENSYLYFSFCPAKRPKTMRISRIPLRGSRLDLASEVVVLEYPFERGQHMGGGLAMDGRGNLYTGTGDDSRHIPDPPHDFRPGKDHHDALRSSANSRDLRGKVLRIVPQADGTYLTPPDNLFPDGKDGRPEIFAMGVRNAFRLSVDERTGWLYFGEVGPNTNLEGGNRADEFMKGLPGGYDEINQVRAAGNFGWPMFTGANEPYALVDYGANRLGAWFSVSDPVNPSPRNTGLRHLPRPQPPLLWYPTTESKEFPTLGRGGRTAMAGPVYHFDEALQSPEKLPERLDGRLFIYDWSRNWIKTVALDREGRAGAIEDFMPGAKFRKPIDMKIAADGTLYLAEFGDTWGGNKDSQIVRIVYRRGNRPPVAVLTAEPSTGRDPLLVHLDGGASHDKDKGERLRFSWRFGDGPSVSSSRPRVTHRFAKVGRYRVALTVSDRRGATGTAETFIHVGNAPPRVHIAWPPHGGFFEEGESVRYRVVADDFEDGSTDDGRIAPSSVVVWGTRHARSPTPHSGGAAAQTAGDEPGVDPGLALMRRSSCFSCHTPSVQSGGPSYRDVAERYRNDSGASERLAAKVLGGGTGVWSDRAMPPNPQHTLAEARLMVGWVLAQSTTAADTPIPGLLGELPLGPDKRLTGGVYVVHARYVDSGAQGQPPLAGEAVHVLHSRRRKAGLADFTHGADVLDDYGGESGLVLHVRAGGSFGFRPVNLRGVDGIVMRAANMVAVPITLEIHSDSPAGPLIGSLELPPRSGDARLSYGEHAVPVVDPGGLHDLVVVARAPERSRGKVASISWLEFKTPPRARPIAGAPTPDGLAPILGQAERNRNYDQARALIAGLGCLACHPFKRGGGLAPDLGSIRHRRAQDSITREELLREMLEPARVVAEPYQIHAVVLKSGEVVHGLVVGRTSDAIKLAPSPVAGAPIRELLLAEVATDRVVAGSMMPDGLLTTLTDDEILDLVAYLESGGDARHPAFRPRR
jgi:cytochrome c